MTRWLAVLCAALLMAGCGGADDPAKEAAEFAGRMHALGVTAASESASAAVTADMLMDWAEYRFPEVFPRATSERFPNIEYLGVVYNARAYWGPWGARFLGVTPDGRIFGVGDLTGYQLQPLNDLGYWATQVLADQCKVDPGSCATVNLAAGGEVALNDGVRLLVLQGSGGGDMTVYARASGGEPGQVVGESRLASYHYTITSSDLERGELTAPMRLSIPVSPSPDALGADPTEFDIQVYNPDTKQWDWIDAWAAYEPATKSVSFWVNHFSEYRAVENVPSNQDRYTRWIVNYDNFRVIYYKPKDGVSGFEFPYAPPSDDAWKGVSGNIDQYSNILNYVEDLNWALDASRDFYLNEIKTSTGANLFSKPGSPPYVRVTYLPASTSGGDSKWGMMRIATSNQNFSELAKVAAHELFHVLSDQYYTVFGAAYNRWFFEAAADLWTTRALRMTREEQLAYFQREMSGYLTVSLDVSDEGSYSAAGDFLGWLETRTNKPIVADVIAGDYVSDLGGLDAVVGATGTSLSDYYVQYVLEASLGSHDLDVPLVARLDVLTGDKAGVHEKIELNHLSATGKGLGTELAVDGLLVVSSDRSTSTSAWMTGKLRTFSYVSDKPYGIDTTRYLELDTVAGKPIVIKHFGKVGTPGVKNSRLFQIIVNSELTDPRPLVLEHEFDAYLLVPPAVSIGSGRVDFTYGATYASKQAVIAGFNVYLDGKKLNTDLLPASARHFSDTRIQLGSAVLVSVVDNYNNEWPEVPQISAPLHCQLEIITGYVDEFGFEGTNSQAYFPPVSGTLAGSVFNVDWNWKPVSTRTDSGAIRFEINANRTNIVSFSASNTTSYSSGDSYVERAVGGNLPVRFEAGKAIAEVRGPGVCSSISTLTWQSFFDGSLSESRTSFQCDAGSLVRIECH